MRNLTLEAKEANCFLKTRIGGTYLYPGFTQPLCPAILWLSLRGIYNQYTGGLEL
jgi:hypothetical protein